MMPVVFADGEFGRTSFVVKGRRVPYRLINVNGIPMTQSLADCFPKGSYITTRQNEAAVDKVSFERWAADFAHECRARTAHGRKVLLLNDGYRIHMSLKALEILKANNTIAYALPPIPAQQHSRSMFLCLIPLNISCERAVQTLPSASIQLTTIYSIYAFSCVSHIKKPSLRIIFCNHFHEQDLAPWIQEICCLSLLLSQRTHLLQWLEFRVWQGF